MTKDDLKAAVLHELGNIAPEIEGETIDQDADLREEFDIDSMDFLNLIIALHRRLGIDIPEADYAKLKSVGSMVDYLQDKAKARRPRA